MKHLSLSGFEQWNFQCPYDAEEVGMEGRAGKRQSICRGGDLRTRTASLAKDMPWLWASQVASSVVKNPPVNVGDLS